MATVNLGSIRFNWKGAYNNSTAYVVNDVVTSSGNSYVCIQASQGNAVGNATAYWNIMSSKGTDADLLNIASTAQGDIYYNNGSAIARLGAGTSGQFLKTQGTSANPTWSDAGGGLQSQQVFTSSGTYTKPSGINIIKVIVTGAGGGGGSGTGSDNHGGGGGAGGTAIEIIDVSSLSSTVAVTIGTGGTVGSANSNTQGGTGGTSSFGSYCSATGGVGSNADINLHGGRGEEHSAQSTQDQSGGGHGGSSYWGGGGRVASSWTTSNSTPGEAYGSGGGGGVHDNRAGAVGAGGVVVVEEYK